MATRTSIKKGMGACGAVKSVAVPYVGSGDREFKAWAKRRARTWLLCDQCLFHCQVAWKAALASVQRQRTRSK